MSTLRERILDVQDLKIVSEPVPEWPVNEDGSEFVMRFRQMTAGQAVKFTERMEGPDGIDGMFLIIIECAIDNTLAAEPLFTAEDLPALKKKNMRVLDRLQRVCLQLNSMRPENEVALKKDSGEVPTGASPIV